ncbi:MAG TPA: beta-ribofuranosylaminobenzene 5'-phosphate synthase family protein [candidate division Zixibacteria bacterium]|nr:beta-ribofuranosylaminobenzene 5'-phosphate synthase family protein [candidate division Zixibacteria bacterium]
MKISVQTPCRLHFGLIDLNGELGRINGGLGVALQKPFWKIIGSDDTKQNHSKLDDKIFLAIKKFDEYFQTDTKEFSIQIKEEIPKHVGLGSNTQFLLAIGKILSKLHRINPTIQEIARAVQRGGTSGIGVAAFEKGGIILDGGHSFGPGKQTDSFLPSSISKAPPPPVIFQYYPPKDWYFLLLIPTINLGSHGDEEVKLFYEKCPIPASNIEKLSRLILMKILPAVVENDIKEFGLGLTEMQTKFERFGMERYEVGLSNEILMELRKHPKVFGSGISSFGPTIFTLTNTVQNAQIILKEIKENFSENKFSLLDYSSISRNGAIIKSL